MRTIVFAGPTLPRPEILHELPNALVLPPAAQGDVYRAALTRPSAIGLIDGYFDRVPSVWHKEILWAMKEGIHVFGAASMGALRAAELDTFGMVGVGEVFLAFRNGELEDDDEVAIRHADKEHGYRPSSEAMVNIRATLRAAAGANIVSLKTAATLERLAKEEFYAGRSYYQVLQAAPQQGVSATEIAALREWLPSGKVDVKRNDALAMLRRMRAFLESAPGPNKVSYSLPITNFLDRLIRQSSEVPVAALHPEAATVLRNLKADPEEHRRAETAALAMAWAESKWKHEGPTNLQDLMAEVVLEFQNTHNLTSPESLADWHRDNHISPEDLNRILLRQMALKWVAEDFGSRLDLLMLDYLRFTGAYSQLIDR